MRYLQLYAYDPNGEPLQIYGDPAYGVNRFLCSLFMGAALSPEERLFNKRMSKVRIIVEWASKEVVSLFPFLDYGKIRSYFFNPLDYSTKWQFSSIMHMYAFIIRKYLNISRI